MDHKFKVGDEVYLINPEGDYSYIIKENNSKNLFTVSEIYLSWVNEDCIRIKEYDLGDGGGYLSKKFELFLRVQDNEFVKMMCSNERMLDICT